MRVVVMADSSSEEEGGEEWMDRHGSDHLLGVPVTARVRGALRLDRPGEVPRVREAGRSVSLSLPASSCPQAKPLSRHRAEDPR